MVCSALLYLSFTMSASTASLHEDMGARGATNRSHSGQGFCQGFSGLPRDATLRSGAVAESGNRVARSPRSDVE